MSAAVADLPRTVRGRPATEATRLRTVGLVVAVWLLVGATRGAIGWLADPHAWRRHLWATGVLMVTKMFWVPVTFIAGWLIRHSPAGRDWRSAWPWCLPLFVSIALVEPLWGRGVLLALGQSVPAYPAFVWGRLDINLLIAVAIWMTLGSLQSYQRGVESEARATALEAELVDAEVRMLTLQLQPHFLFNTLHLASEMIYDDAVGATDVIRRLRALLAQSLTFSARREVTVDEEVAFLRDYLSIQERRFGGRISAMIDVAADAGTGLMPHLLLQPLVENAIRHGLSPRRSGGTVWTSVRRSGSRLSIVVEDDGVGMARPLEGQRTSGFGLAHTRLRLERLYPADAGFDVGSRAAGGVRVSIDLPFHDRVADVPNPGPEPEQPIQPVDETSGSSGVRRLPWVFAAWTLTAAVWTQLGMFDGAALGHPQALGSLAATNGLAALLGALVSIPALARAFVPLRRDALRAGVLGQLARSLGFAAVHCGLLVLLVRGPLFHLMPAEVRDNLAPGVVAWMMWDALAYLTVVALVNRGAFVRWQHDAQLAAARLRRRITLVRSELYRGSLQPVTLLARLDDIAGSAPDAAQWELKIAELGGHLRQLLAEAARGLETRHVAAFP